MAKNAGVDIAYAAWGRKNVPEITELMQRWCDYTVDEPQHLYDFLFGDV